MKKSWKEDSLGNLLELIYGLSLPKAVRNVGSVPVYGSNGIVGYNDKPFVFDEGIIVGRKGSAGNVHYSEIPFCPIDTTFYITQKNTILNLRFLYYALLKLDLKRILGDVGVPGLNRRMAYMEKLRYPTDKNEQIKIGKILNKLQKG